MTRVKVSILSISLLIIMAGAAVAPVLADISLYFRDVHPQLVKMIMTLPALMIIPFSFLTGFLAKRYRKKHLALWGLIGYLIGGVGSGFADNIFSILLLRALLGASVGVLSPLAIGLIADLFSGAERTKMMGYSAASNNLGGALATVAAGILAVFHWRYAFLIYGLSFLVFMLVYFFLPKDAGWDKPEDVYVDVQMKKSGKGTLKWASFTFFMIIIFFSIPTHLDFFIFAENLGTSATTGILMGLLTGISLLTGVIFQKLVAILRDKTAIISFLFLLAGFLFLSIFSNIYAIGAAIVFAGLSIGLLIPLIMDSVTKEVRPGDTIFALAVINFSLYLGQFISPLIPGLLESLLSIDSTRFPFYVSAIMSFLAVLGLWFFRKPKFTPSSYLYENQK